MIVPVILSGGAGSRLWPLSCEQYPKQFLPLLGQDTLLQSTVHRLDGLPISAPLVVCNEEHRFVVAEQLREIKRPASGIILEPVAHNTAPAVALAALQVLRSGDDSTLLVLPADHVVLHPKRFRQAIMDIFPLAKDGRLVTFGINPSLPETGYGYIKAGIPMKLPSNCPAYAVDKFVEKPDVVTAQSYLDAGGYSWNSGMFMFKASVFMRELKRFAPEMFHCCHEAFSDARRDTDFIRIDGDIFKACPSESIDYAVMEKTALAAVMPLDVGWNDVGSWTTLWDIGEKDSSGNVVKGNVLVHDVKGSYLHAEHRTVAAVGVRDLTIVETAEAVLVTHKERAQDVKKIVEILKAGERNDALMQRRVARPWGSYECVAWAERFLVKEIVVNPGASLSLQRHQHRSEHWIVVSGTARVTRGDTLLTLRENQSTYIPRGEVHRLENPGTTPLEIIEVQSGDYLGEDDIERFDDEYGRMQ